MVSFESPRTPKPDKSEAEKLLKKLKQVKKRLEDQEDIEVINEKIKTLQADVQSDAETRSKSSMTESEYQQKIEDSESVRSPKESSLDEDKKQAPADVKERAKIVRKKLGEEIDEETAEKLFGELSKKEKKEFEEKHESTKESESIEQGVPRSFVDVSSEEILQTLSVQERDLIRAHRDLFDRLNEANTSSERTAIFKQQMKAEGFSPQGSEQRAVYDIVVDLKEKYS